MAIAVLEARLSRGMVFGASTLKCAMDAIRMDWAKDCVERIWDCGTVEHCLDIYYDGPRGNSAVKCTIVEVIRKELEYGQMGRGTSTWTVAKTKRPNSWYIQDNYIYTVVEPKIS